MAGDGSGSLFRVGDNVELSRVFGMVSVLVFCIMVLEHLLHKLEHHLHKYPKYHEMMTKIFGELMILGLIGLGIKILKEVTSLDAYGKPMIAFQAADLTIFLLAIGLVLQALVIFLRLRRNNVQTDKAELVSTQYLVQRMENRQKPGMGCLSRSWGRKSRALHARDFSAVARVRMLRHLFLTTYDLPELFPFSKYLRQAQDNEISHMIEAKISTWMCLLLVAWGLLVLASIVEARSGMKTHYAITVAFATFSWLLVVINGFISAYFSWAIGQLLRAATNGQQRKTRAERIACLHQIADEERESAAQQGSISASDTIVQMEIVREAQHTHNHHRVRTLLKSKAATLFQAPHTAPPPAAPRSYISVAFFSRRVWHFCVIFSLMLNAFYFALFCQCVVFQMRQIYDRVGIVPAILVPLPLLVNAIVLQPRILRDFILVASIVRVDDVALGEVIDHFRETVTLRARFTEAMLKQLEHEQKTLVDLDKALATCDSNKTGHIEIEELRLVLNAFGLELSYFRFNGLAKLLFDLHGTLVDYRQVLRLLGHQRRSSVTVSLSSLPGDSTGFESDDALRNTTAEDARALFRLDSKESNTADDDLSVQYVRL